MEEMYQTGLQIHDAALIVLGGVVIFNLAMLMMSQHVVRYARRMRIVMPISATLITAIIFTGTVMMAAKHLSFTIANGAMIIASVAMIVFEAKRYSILKRKTDIHSEDGFMGYKKKAYRLLGGEMAMILIMTLWMVR